MNRQSFALVTAVVLIGVIFLIAGYLYYQKDITSLPAQNIQSNTSTTQSLSEQSSTTVGSTSISAVTNPAQRPSCALSANPEKIIIPQYSLLTWDCQNATACSITSDRNNNFSNQHSVSRTLKVIPTATTNYVLSCIGINNATLSNAVRVTVGSGINNNCGQPGLCE